MAYYEDTLKDLVFELGEIYKVDLDNNLWDIIKVSSKDTDNKYIPSIIRPINTAYVPDKRYLRDTGVIVDCKVDNPTREALELFITMAIQMCHVDETIVDLFAFNSIQYLFGTSLPKMSLYGKLVRHDVEIYVQSANLITFGINDILVVNHESNKSYILNVDGTIENVLNQLVNGDQLQ